MRFEKSAAPVLVFGLRRGGSTMITDAISANKGVWFADEPFAMFPHRPGYAEKEARLFVPQHSHFFGLSGEQQDRFASFAHDLLAARFRKMGTARYAKGILRADRSSLKILNAPWMLPWFAQETDAYILAITRHPGAQAQSVLRQGWAYPAEAYLQRPDVLGDGFSQDQIAYAQQVFAAADPWRLAVLDWVLTSHPLRVAQGVQVIRCTYEDIVKDPARFIDEVLIARCGLIDRGAMLKAILKPSRSSHLNTADGTQSIAQRDVEQMVNGWRARTSDTQLSSGQEILDTFGVTTYRFLP